MDLVQQKNGLTETATWHDDMTSLKWQHGIMT